MIEYNNISMKHDNEILIIGNGFDLRAGIKSSFNDFIIFVALGCVLDNYQNYQLFKNRYKMFKKSVKQLNKSLDKEFKSYFDTFKIILNTSVQGSKKLSTRCREFAENDFGKLLLEHIFNRMYKYLVINEVDTDYSNQESILKREAFDRDCLAVYGLGFTFEEYLSDYYRIPDEQCSDRFNKGVVTALSFILDDMRSNSSNVLLWSDVESVIEMIVTDSKYLRVKYEFKEKIKKDFLSINHYLRGLYLFEFLLSIYLTKIQARNIKDATVFFDDIKNCYSKSLKKRSCGAIDFINLLDQPRVIINYNYTNIAKKYYYDCCNKDVDIIHINGSLEVNENNKVDEIGTNIVVGYSNIRKKYVIKDFYLFEKQARRLVKNTVYLNTSKIINKEYFNLVIIGHSCGVSDSDVLRPLLSSEYLKTAVILCHTTDDLAMIYTNLREMLDEQKFCELLTYDPAKRNHNLYFSVEHSHDK